MRARFGSVLTVLAILGTVAAVGIATKEGGGSRPASAANVAAVQHHLERCPICRASGLSAARLASEARPIPCLARDQAPATD